MPKPDKSMSARWPLALAAGVPMVWASYQTNDRRARIGLRVLAAATVAIDGWLMVRAAGPPVAGRGRAV